MDSPFFSSVSSTQLGGGGKGGEALQALRSENVVLFRSIKQGGEGGDVEENYRVAVTSGDGY